jgi:hypothetical protein
MTTTWKQLEDAGRNAGARYPELVAAQWALESGWGRHTSGRHNYFGLKGSGTTTSTKEFIDGVWVTILAGFLNFDSVNDCVKYLVSKWYKDYKNWKGCNNAANRNEAAKWLVKEGYATDPKYAEKLIKLMDEHSSTPKPMTQAVKWPAGIIGPKKRPQDFGFKRGDSHLIANDKVEKLDAYSFDGKKLWSIPCLCRGQGSDYVWTETNTDTPPGLYRLGTVYNDIDRVGLNPSFSETLMAYGWIFFDMVELEGQERRYSRAGIGLHGGGSALGWPAAWEPRQRLVSTLGCVRIHNIDLRDKILPLTKQGAVYVSVLQEG